jgi:mono/diheme cytochrome c family protein
VYTVPIPHRATVFFDLLNGAEIQGERATFTKIATAGAALRLVLFMGTLIPSQRMRAQNQNGEGGDDPRIAQGFAISPVPPNLKGKNPAQIAQVGLGSYLVNAIGDCNGCHTSGGPPNFNYLAGANPYFLNQGPAKVDPSTYLAGGTDFGPAIPFNVGAGTAYGNNVGPDIISRNLTPVAAILRPRRSCIPPPVNGAVLEVMPWPTFHNMEDSDIEAIYEYLSTIPCIDTSTPPVGAPNELRNDCGNGPPPAPKFVHDTSH